MSDALTITGETLVKSYLSAIEHEEYCKRRLNHATTARMNAETKLAEWILPADAQVNEKIAVWQGDSLFQAHIDQYGHLRVNIRTRGRMS